MAKAKNEVVPAENVAPPTPEVVATTEAPESADPTLESHVKAVLEAMKPQAPPTIPPTPTIGRVVIYKLSEQNAADINRRRTTGYSIVERIKLNCNSQTLWPLGAQAHIGNECHAGDEFPMTIVRVWSGTCVNGQVLLDGSDSYWATSVAPGDGEGQWHWPVKS